MEMKFPDISLYKGWGKPFRVESRIDALELIQGAPPPGLEGTWYKAGPDRQFPAMAGEDTFMDGEGMVHMFRFEGGRVDYRSQWVRNERFKAQEAAGRSLFGGYRDIFTRDPSAKDLHGGTANTNIVYHAGRLLALKEDDMPYELKPDTLETIGRYTYDGKVASLRLSAHPKADLVNDTLLNFGHQAKGDGTPDTVFYEFDRDDNIIDEIWFEAPFSGLVHDFVITQNHVVFAFEPLVTDLEVLKRTGLFYQWRPEHGMKIAVLKRRGTAADIRWFNGPPATFGHTLNAYEKDGKILFDILLSDGNGLGFMFPGRDGQRTAPLPQFLRRIVIDLASNSGEYAIEPNRGIMLELPCIDNRYTGAPYRHVWCIAPRPLKAPSSDTMSFIDAEADISRYDLLTGAQDRFDLGDGANLQEPTFVPRSPDSAEGDGWLLVLVNRLTEGRCELMVFDAMNVAAGPVATWSVPIRIRLTFHGNWVPAPTFVTHRYAMSRVE